MKLEDDPDGEVLTVDEKQLCVEMDRLEGAMEHEESFLRLTSLMLTMSARGPTLMKRRCARNHRKRELGPHTTCFQVDGKCISRIRRISQPQTQRSRPLETGSKLSRSLKMKIIATTAAMTAMGVKRLMRGGQCHASRAPRRPRRQGRTSTGIVLSEQLDFPSLRRDNRGSKLSWLATKPKEKQQKQKAETKKTKKKKKQDDDFPHLFRVFQQFFRCVAAPPQLRNSCSTNS